MERTVTVIVDGNNHNIQVNGKNVIFQTKITNNVVTLTKCQEVTELVRKYGHEPKKLVFLLQIFEEPDDEGYAPYILNKEARYFVRQNRLEIWLNNELVYENNDGIICDDPVALADCYND